MTPLNGVMGAGFIGPKVTLLVIVTVTYTGVVLVEIKA